MAKHEGRLLPEEELIVAAMPDDWTVQFERAENSPLLKVSVLIPGKWPLSETFTPKGSEKPIDGPSAVAAFLEEIRERYAKGW